MKLILVGCVLLSAALSCQCAAWEGEWEEWKMSYNKQYATELQETMAREIWRRNMAHIRAHNSRADVTYSLEMNEFGDQLVHPGLTSFEERKARPSETHDVFRSLLFQPPPPSSWDWRTKGVISPVENQGRMGSSDAISITECIESVHAIKTGQLVRLSVEELNDCCLKGSVIPDPFGCVGKLGGLCSESAYPPAPSAKLTCRSKQCTAAANDVNTTVHVKEKDEEAMALAVLEAPLVVYVDASSASFMFYKSGVFTSPSPSCGTKLNHAMQLVGYDKDYWILKNSWGAEWGMKGYMLMKRGDNVCGVANAAIYPR